MGYQHVTGVIRVVLLVCIRGVVVGKVGLLFFLIPCVGRGLSWLVGVATERVRACYGWSIL